MERREDAVTGQGVDEGQGWEPLHPGPASHRRSARVDKWPLETPGRMPDAGDLAGRHAVAPWVDWRSALYVVVLGFVCLFLAPRTNFWWIAPVLGALVPLALAVRHRPALPPGSADERKAKEGEVLDVLAEHGEVTPAAVAMRTSLTVDEATRMLNGLAGSGALQVRVQDGMIVLYALPDRDRRPEHSGPSGPSGPEPGGGHAPHPVAQPLDDPLSEREVEVLTLLASGRTNAEIARDLFVAVSMVKSHVSNIYRKLDATNRAEAVTRARELRLLH